MILYLHIGTEKTGSSYLQTLAGVNRLVLRRNGYFFPHAGRLEHQMLSGKISGGNGHELTKAIESNNYKKCNHFLKEVGNQAKENNCDKALLSHELLVLALSSQKRVIKFLDACNKAGFKAIKCLLVIRDPVEQAFSLYKHRSKGGNMIEIHEWLTGHYKYGSGLLKFISAMDQTDLKVSCIKYFHTEGNLENKFFKEWLNIPDVLSPAPKKIVNPSLTLSELIFIKNIKAQDPILANIFYEEMLKLPKSVKAGNASIEQYYLSTISNHLSKFGKTWVACNCLLMEEQKIEIPRQFSEVDRVNENTIFSLDQVKQLATLYGKMTRPSFQIKYIYLKLKKNVRPFINKILDKK